MEPVPAAELSRIAAQLATTADELASLAERLAATNDMTSEPAPTAAVPDFSAPAARPADLDAIVVRHDNAAARLDQATSAVAVAAQQAGRSGEELLHVRQQLESTLTPLPDAPVETEPDTARYTAERHAYLQDRANELAERHAAAQEMQARAEQDRAAAEAELRRAQDELAVALSRFDRTPKDDTPVRELVIAALGELQAPVGSADLAEYIKIRYGRDIDTGRFGTLRRDEERAYVSAQRSGRERPVWLVPGLHLDGRADRRYLTRSDWTLGRRYTGNDPEARAYYHLLDIADSLPLDTVDPVGLLELARRGSEEFGPLWDDSFGGIQAVLMSFLAPMDGPGEFVPGAVFPDKPTTPASLRRWSEGPETDEHQRLFGADHDLDLDDDTRPSS